MKNEGNAVKYSWRIRAKGARPSSFIPHTSSFPWLLLSPWLLTLALFWAYPLLYAFYLSFTKYYTLTNRSVWIGFGNYTRLAHDPAFWQALLNTLVFVVGTVPFTMFFVLFFP